MRSLILTAILLVALTSELGQSRHVRSARQIEREGYPPREFGEAVDASEEKPAVDEPKTSEKPEDVDPNYDPNNDAGAVEVDINKDGTMDFGGHIPSFVPRRDVPDVFRKLFEVLHKRFDRGPTVVMGRFPSFPRRGGFPSRGSFPSRGGFPSLFDRFPSIHRLPNPSFGELPKPSKYPNNYNDTTTDVVTINGRRFVKKETVVKKEVGNTKIFLTRISYVPVNDAENTEDVDVGPTKDREPLTPVEVPEDDREPLIPGGGPDPVEEPEAGRKPFYPSENPEFVPRDTEAQDPGSITDKKAERYTSA